MFIYSSTLPQIFFLFLIVLYPQYNNPQHCYTYRLLPSIQSLLLRGSHINKSFFQPLLAHNPSNFNSLPKKRQPLLVCIKGKQPRIPTTLNASIIVKDFLYFDSMKMMLSTEWSQFYTHYPPLSLELSEASLWFKSLPPHD